jgi:hypothetical protein
MSYKFGTIGHPAKYSADRESLEIGLEVVAHERVVLENSCLEFLARKENVRPKSILNDEFVDSGAIGIDALFFLLCQSLANELQRLIPVSTFEARELLSPFFVDL